MKKMIVVLTAAAALGAAAAAPAPASAQGCRTVKCFNKQIAVLQSEVGQLSTALNCVQPVAVSRYGGYDYNGYAAATTAIDFSESGDPVSTWVLGIQPGTCGSPQTRAAVSSASASPDTAARDASPFGPFQAMPGITRETTKTNLGG
jgi:hypothetical protein